MTTEIALAWKLRRIAAGLRQQDVAARIGVSNTRYSTLERGEAAPADWESEAIEQILPQLPVNPHPRANLPQSRQDSSNKEVPHYRYEEDLDG